MTRKLLACLSLLIVLSTAVSAATVNTPQPQTVSRITEPVNDSLRVVLKGNVPREAQAQYDRGAVPASMPASRLMLVLKHSPTQAQAVREYIDSLQNKSSSNYHKWLTPEEFGAKYGPSDEDLKTVTDWLASHGFTVNRVAKARNLVEFSGTAGSVQEAFHTSIHSYEINGERLFANATDPEIPAALAPVVAGVTKLNNFNPKRNVVPGRSARWNAERGPGNDITWIDPYNDTDLYVVPADVAAIYNTPNAQLNPAYTGTTYDGTGVTVGIIGDANFTMQDVANYRAFFLNDTSAAHLPNVIIDGNDPGLNNDTVEALLDTEVLGGVAPGATINYYTAASTNLQDGLFLAISRALDDNAVSILNLSFGYCEYGMGSDANQLFYQYWEQAAAQGISVTVSSGDTGSANCDSQGQAASYNGLAVSGFTSTPYNVSVGGTDFAALSSNYPASFKQYMNSSGGGVAPYYGSAAGYIPETPWNNTTISNTTLDLNQNDGQPLGGGGGGMSSCAFQANGGCTGGYPKPAFQANLTPADGARDVPDVSLFASNGFNYAIWAICADSAVYNTPGTDCQLVNGKPNGSTTISGVGGTSASSPAFAGMLALISQSAGGRLGNPNPAMYSIAMNTPAVINDVVVGNIAQPCAFTFLAGCIAVADGDLFLDGYNAGPGYDLATGLGSVNAAKLLTAWPTAVFTPTQESVFLVGESQATLSPSGLTATHGTPIDFFLAMNPASGTMTGDITLVTDSDTASMPSSGAVSGSLYPVNSPTVTGGVVTGTTNTLPGGTYNLYAYYGGDTNFAASKSSPIPVTINPESSSTTLTVYFYDAISQQLVSSTTAPYGSFFELDGVPQSQNQQSPFDGVPTGTMTFLNGSTPVGPAVNLNSAGLGELDNTYSANSNPNWLPAGSYQLVASYSGDASFKPSKSAASTIVITKGPISNALTASTSGLNYGGSLTLTVAIQTDSIGNYPTGLITFMSGTTVLGTTPIIGGTDPTTYLDTGTATATIPGTQFTKNGNNFVSAIYAGDANYMPSTSNDVLIDVTGVPTPSFGVGGPATILLSNPGASSPATITVTPFGGFTGSVQLTCVITGPSNAVSTPTCTPANANITGTSAATATVNVDSTSTTTPYTYSLLVTGTDAATGKITASTAIPVTVTAPPAPSFALSSVAAVIAGPGTSTTSTITVTPSNGFTGVVNLTCSSATAGLTCTPAIATVGASNGTASLNIQSTSATPLGTDTLTVNGVDAATGAITSSTTVQVTVNAPIIPGITISGTPVTIASPGATGTSTITLTPTGGFSGTVTLTCTATVSPFGAVSPPACPSTTASITGSAAATTALSLQTTVTTTPGAYSIAVTATAGSTVSTTNVAVIVTPSTVPASFALTGTQVSIASLGANGSSTITVTPAGGFTGQVNLKCAMTTAPSGANDNPTCTFGSTNSVFIGGVTPGTATMTVNTSTTAAALQVLHGGRWIGTAGGAALAGLLFFCLPARRRNRFLMLALLIMALAAGASGCGGSSQPTVNGTGAFTFTVTGADAATGTIVSTTTVTVNVQ